MKLKIGNVELHISAKFIFALSILVSTVLGFVL